MKIYFFIYFNEIFLCISIWKLAIYFAQEKSRAQSRQQNQFRTYRSENNENVKSYHHLVFIDTGYRHKSHMCYCKISLCHRNSTGTRVFIPIVQNVCDYAIFSNFDATLCICIKYFVVFRWKIFAPIWNSIEKLLQKSFVRWIHCKVSNIFPVKVQNAWSDVIEYAAELTTPF